MSFKAGDRIKETTLSTGTGPLVLAGAQLGGWKPFSSYLSDGDTTVYAVVDPFTGLWEAGIGTWVLASNHIVRTDAGVFAGSSGAGTRVNLPATVKDVFNTNPAVAILLAQAGTAALPGLSFYANQDLGLNPVSATVLGLCASGAAEVGVATGGLLSKLAGLLKWTDGLLTGTVDTAIAKAAAAVLTVSDGAAGLGWMKSPAGESYLAADDAIASVGYVTMSMTPVMTLKAGRKYAIELHVMGNVATPAQGAKIDINGGTLTVTNLRIQGLAIDGAIQMSQQGTTLAQQYQAASFNTGDFYLRGTIEVNAGGTLIPRFSKNSAGAANFSIRRGSRLHALDIT